MNPEQETPAFSITDERGLTWYVRKIAAIDSEIARVQNQAKSIIAELERDRQSLEFQFGIQVEAVTRDLLEGKRAKHLKTMFGNIGFRTNPARLEITDQKALLAWSQQHAPDLLETKVTIARLSERFKPSGNGISLFDTQADGVTLEIPGISIKPAEQRFYIKTGSTEE